MSANPILTLELWDCAPRRESTLQEPGSAPGRVGYIGRPDLRVAKPLLRAARRRERGGVVHTQVEANADRLDNEDALVRHVLRETGPRRRRSSGRLVPKRRVLRRAAPETVICPHRWRRVARARSSEPSRGGTATRWPGWPLPQELGNDLLHAD